MKCRYYSVQGTSYLFFSYTGTLLSDAKSVNIRDKKKLRFSEVKKKTRYFYIHRRPILYQTENHDH